MSVLDLGHGVTMKSACMPDSSEREGYFWRHPRPDNGAECDGGWIATNPDNPRPWRVEQEEPALTLSPSLLCTACGCHGFVRDGKWVPA